MKVFGIGLEKTGTSTLGKALEMLGFERHKGFDLQLLQQFKSGHLEAIMEAAADYDNFENYPWSFIYEEAYHRFPDAKFILTVRTTSRRWFSSISHHARKTGPSEVRQLVYGHSMPHLFEAEDTRFYEKHNQAVHAFFDANDSSRLLEVCWAKEDGWNELCTFLEKPIPEVDFPHLNR